MSWMWYAVRRLRRVEGREGGCAASSGELVRVGILGDVGSQFSTLVHQGSESFRSLVIRCVVLFPHPI